MSGGFTVDGPPVRVPGSAQFMFGVGILVVVVGLVALAVAVFVRLRRRRAGTPRRRPVGIAVASVVALVGAGIAVTNRPLPFVVPEFPAVPRLFPAGSVFYRTATDLPLAPASRSAVAALRGSDGAPLPLVPGFSGRVVDGVVWGTPFNPSTPSTPRDDVSIRQATATSFAGPYPITDPAYIESMPSYGIDNHYVAIDPGARRMWELLSTRRWFGRWEADAGVEWNLDDLAYPRGSSTASGLPLFPGTVTYDEVAAGSVDHVALLISPVVGTGTPVWPARATDGTSTAAGAPPMGTWLRLRPDVSLDGLGPQARVVAEGLRRHGMVLSDTGARFGIRGTPDRRWDDDDLRTLSTLTAADFEVVDASGIEVEAGSMEARPPG